MLTVNRKYSKGNRRVAPKTIGYHVKRTNGSFAEWNMKEFGHNWASMAAYNWASLREEGGGRCSTATSNAIKRKFKRRWTIERLLGRL